MKRVSGGGRKQESFVWDYFRYDPTTDKSNCLCVILKNDKDNIVDNVCGKVIKGKNPTNLKTHLECFHEDAFIDFIEKEKSRNMGKAKTRVKIFRDKYDRYNKKQPRIIGRKDSRLWPLASSFLNGGSEFNESVSNCEHENATSFQEDEAGFGQYPDIAKSPKSTDIKSFRRSSLITELVDQAIIQYLAKGKEVEDEDCLFGKTIGITISKLKPHIKRRVKMNIMLAINSGEEEQEREATINYEKMTSYDSATLSLYNDKVIT